MRSVLVVEVDGEIGQEPRREDDRDHEPLITGHHALLGALVFGALPYLFSFGWGKPANVTRTAGRTGALGTISEHTHWVVPETSAHPARPGLAATGRDIWWYRRAWRGRDQAPLPRPSHDASCRATLAPPLRPAGRTAAVDESGPEHTRSAPPRACTRPRRPS